MIDRRSTLRRGNKKIKNIYNNLIKNKKFLDLFIYKEQAMYKIDKEIKTKLTEKEIKTKLYNISSKKGHGSIFFIPNQEKFFIKEVEDSIVLYTIPYYKNRGFVPKIRIKMYSDGENTIMTMKYSLYFEAELVIAIVNIILMISSLVILIMDSSNRYWGLYIIIFVIFCDFGFYKTFKNEVEKIMEYFNEYFKVSCTT